jgi:hypothetical protein
MRGKYSPTVSAAYYKDQQWWDNYRVDTPGKYQSYDPEGFDSYGYNANDIDRAGNHENDYIPNNSLHWEDGDDYNNAYEDAYDAWTFDGVKPVKFVRH